MKFVYQMALIASMVSPAMSQAQTLVGSWPENGGNITIMAVCGPLPITGLHFASSNNGLIPVPSLDHSSPRADPFTFFLMNDVDNVLYLNLGGRTITIDGQLELSVGAKQGAEVTATWGDGPTPVPFQVSSDETSGSANGGDDCENDGGEDDGGGNDGGESPNPCGDVPICATFPTTGGPITLRSHTPTHVTGLDFTSTNHGLIPVEGGAGLPFTFLVENSSSRVRYTNLGSTVTVDGELKMSVSATPGAELSATWNDGPTTIALPIGPAEAVVPEPTGGLLAVGSSLGLLLGFRRRRSPLAS